MDSKRIASLFVIFVALFTFVLIGYLTYDSLEDNTTATYLKFDNEQAAHESLETIKNQILDNEYTILSGHILRNTALDETFVLNPENGNRLSIYIKNDISDASPFHVHIYKNGQNIHTDELAQNEMGIYTRKIRSNATYKIQFDSENNEIPFSAYLEVKQYHVDDPDEEDEEQENIINEREKGDIVM